MSSNAEQFAAFAIEDNPFKSTRRMTVDAEMDITPMIDITFLLLIFFLVASKVDSDSEIILPKAKNGTAVTTKSSAVLTVTDGDGEQAIIYTGDGADDAHRIRTTDLAEQEAIIAEYIDRMIHDENKEQVIIKASKSVRHRDVARVMRAIGQVEDAKIYVAVLEEG